MRARLHLGDCLELLATLPDNLIDAVVTDPPYGLGKPPKAKDILSAWLAGERAEVSGGGFMGKDWDAFVPGPRIWREVYRVTKPGGHAVVFAGTRTLDWMAMACRLAGWEVRDSGVWCYWSGFPKSLDVSKAIDRQRDDRAQILQVTKWIADVRDAAGVTNRDIDDAFGFRGMAGHWTSQKSQPSVPTLEQIPRLLEALQDPEVPAEIQQLIVDLNGRKGEPGEAWFQREVVGRGQSGANALMGGLRGVMIGSGHDITEPATDHAKRWEGWGTALKPAWEPWLVLRKPLDGTVAANVLEHGTGGINVDGCRFKPGDPMWPGPSCGDQLEAKHKSVAGLSARMSGHVLGQWDATRSSGFSRLGRWPANLIHVAKPSRSEREQGLDRIPGRTGAETVERAEGSAGINNPRAGAGRTADTLKNDHPTVKPRRLMAWLVRLVTPPGGTVLDPFMGSGTTGAAATGQGFDFMGADLSARYVAIAHERIRHSAPGVTIDAPREALDILQESTVPTLWDTLAATRPPQDAEPSEVGATLGEPTGRARDATESQGDATTGVSDG